MKKHILTICAAVICTFVSCQKSEIGGSGKVEPISFSACIYDATKTAIAIEGDKGKITWTAGDEITVTRTSDSATATYTADSDGARTTFSYSSGTEFTDESASYSATYGDIDNQTYSATGANCPMSANETVGTDFIFTESAAMLKLNVKADGVSVKEVRAAGKLLDCGAGVALNTSAGTDFYIAIPAGAYDKLAFTFIATDGTSCTKKIKNPLALAANEIQPVTLNTALVFSAPAAGSAVYYDSEGNSSAVKPEAWEETSNVYFQITDFDWDNQSIEASFSCSHTQYAGQKAFAVGGYHLWGWNGALAWVETNNVAEPLLWMGITCGENGNNISNASGKYEFDQYVLVNKNGLYMSTDPANFGDPIITPSNNTHFADLIDEMGLGKPAQLNVGWTASHAMMNYIKVISGGSHVAVTGVSLDQTEKAIAAGDNFTLHATVAPGGASNQNISWMSDNPSVATVAGGTVTGIKGGTAHITVFTEEGGYSATCTVTVHEPVHVTGVSLDKASHTFTSEYQSLTLNATVSPLDADDASISWTTSDADVATVTNAGVVSPVGEGTATITVTTTDGGYTATCEITVDYPDPPAPGETYYLDINGNHCNTPQAFDIPAAGFMIDLTLDDLDISAGDLVEIRFTHNRKAGERFICIGNKNHFSLDNGKYPGAYGGTVVWAKATGSGATGNWCSVYNSSNGSWGGSDDQEAGFRISEYDGIKRYSGTSDSWIDLSENPSPNNGDKQSEAISKLEALNTISIGSFGTLTEDPCNTITYIKITKAATESGSLSSSDTAPISQGTITTW